MSRVLHPARHIIGHFGEFFQAITCTGTDNTKQIGEPNTKTHKTNKLALGEKTHKNP